MHLILNFQLHQWWKKQVQLKMSSGMKAEATGNDIRYGGRSNWKCDGRRRSNWTWHLWWKQKQPKMTPVMNKDATENEISDGRRSNWKWYQWWTKKQLKRTSVTEAEVTAMTSVMEERVCSSSSSAFINVNCITIIWARIALL